MYQTTQACCNRTVPIILLIFSYCFVGFQSAQLDLNIWISCECCPFGNILDFEKNICSILFNYCKFSCQFLYSFHRDLRGFRLMRAAHEKFSTSPQNFFHASLFAFRRASSCLGYSKQYFEVSCISFINYNFNC